MKNDWLAATHFERMQETISAINSLSIHAKLTLAGIANPMPSREVEQARERLAGLLTNLENVARRAAVDRRDTVVGTDPWLRSVALEFMSDDGWPDGRPEPREQGLDQVKDLVHSERLDDLQRLIPVLDKLRSVIVEQTQGDVASVLGNDSW